VIPTAELTGCRTAAPHTMRRFAFAQVTVFGWRIERLVEDRGGDFEAAARFRGTAHACLGAGTEELTQMNANGTQMNANGPELDAISSRIIGCAFAVTNAPGSGFLEKVYENALAAELGMAGLAVEQQRGITVTYKGIVVGEYFVDLLVEDAVLVELKTVRALDRAHRAQCINYLRATGRHLCLLLNFGLPRLEFQRVVLDL
jgi:GxxExxY protein